MTSSQKQRLVKFQNISHFTKKVSEKITKKNLKSFLKTALLQENYKISHHTKIVYNFIEELNLYEIYSFETLFKNPILPFDLLEHSTAFDKEEEYVLVISEDFFALLENKKFLFAYENKSYTTDEIINFVALSYKINITHPVFISILELEEEQYATLDTIKPHFITLESKGKNYFFLLLSSFLIVGGIYSYFFLSSSNQSEHKKTTIKENSNNSTNKSSPKIIQEVILFLQLLHKHEIILEKLKYDTKLKATLKAKTDSLHIFMKNYKKNIKIIQIDKNDDDFLRAEIEIEF